MFGSIIEGDSYNKLYLGGWNISRGDGSLCRHLRGTWGRCGGDLGGCWGLLLLILRVQTSLPHSCGGALTPITGRGTPWGFRGKEVPDLFPIEFGDTQFSAPWEGNSPILSLSQVGCQLLLAVLAKEVKEFLVLFPY